MSRILYVEGFGDKAFFDSVLKRMNVFRGENKIDVKELEIEVLPQTGKPNLKKNIDKELMEQLKSGGITHFGIVVDADSVMQNNNGGGFAKTLEDVSEIITNMNYGYEAPTKLHENTNSGFVLKNNNGLPKIGLWIMPNNQADGMFEDFVLANIKQESLKLSDYAKEIIDGLHAKQLITEENLFKQHHASKAQVGTWNAWQQIPNNSIKIEHINESGAQVVQLINWLKAVYELPENEIVTENEVMNAA